MNDKKSVMSLGDAAKLAECSRDTIRRAAQRQELPAQMGPGKRGPQWWVREADLLDWIQNRNLGSSSPVAQQSKKSAEQSTASAASSEAQQADVAEAEFTFEPVEEGEELSTETEGEVINFDSEVVSADVHKAVISELVDELRRADRQMIAMQMQLSQNQNLLAERAESLMKSEAEEKAKAERTVQLEKEKAEHAEQAQHAQQELERAQAELKEARAELSRWEEYRKKPFWKRWFRGA